MNHDRTYEAVTVGGWTWSDWKDKKGNCGDATGRTHVSQRARKGERMGRAEVIEFERTEDEGELEEGVGLVGRRLARA